MKMTRKDFQVHKLQKEKLEAFSNFSKSCNLLTLNNFKK